MRKSLQMQNIISKLARRRGLDLADIETHFTAKSPGFMDLVVEVIAPHQVSVAHYYEQNGDLCQDPEIVFFVSPVDGSWYAIEITTPGVMLRGRIFGGYESLVEFDDSGNLKNYKLRAQRDAAIFANKWAKNIRMQGFE